MTTTKKHWREFKIFIKQYKKRSEEDQRLADMGLPSSNNEEDDDDYQTARISFPLEDVVDYFESYNSERDIHGVCLTLAHGISYFVCTPYDKFKAMRVEAGIEGDVDKCCAQKIVKVEETF